VASSTSFSIAPSGFGPVKNYLGKSQFSADPLFGGQLEAVAIADYAMTPAQVSRLYQVAQDPTNLSYTFGTGSFTLSWPADHTGWRLQANTNSILTGFDANWSDVPGSNATNSMILPMDSHEGSVFYRLIYP